jgi:hypothetical protein
MRRSFIKLSRHVSSNYTIEHPGSECRLCGGELVGFNFRFGLEIGNSNAL